VGFGAARSACEEVGKQLRDVAGRAVSNERDMREREMKSAADPKTDGALRSILRKLSRS
jgi:hypothetical protein